MMAPILFLAISLATIFIAAILTYMGGAIRQRKRLSQVLLLSLAALQATSAVFLFTANLPPRDAKPFEDSFNREVRLSNDRHFDVLNPDQDLWGKPGTEGCLTLWTHQGDTWEKPNEAMPPRNIVYRDCDAGRFEAELTIRTFWPRENWQQAGLIVFEDLDNYVRLTAGSGDAPNSMGQVHSVQVVPERAGQPFDVQHLAITEDGVTPRRASSGALENLRLRISRDEDEWKFEWWSPFLTRWEVVCRMTFSFNPSHIGILAFHGISDGEKNPIILDFVQCDIESFVIRPLW